MSTVANEKTKYLVYSYGQIMITVSESNVCGKVNECFISF